MSVVQAVANPGNSSGTPAVTAAAAWDDLYPFVTDLVPAMASSNSFSALKRLLTSDLGKALGVTLAPCHLHRYGTADVLVSHPRLLLIVRCGDCGAVTRCLHLANAHAVEALTGVPVEGSDADVCTICSRELGEQAINGACAHAGDESYLVYVHPMVNNRVKRGFHPIDTKRVIPRKYLSPGAGYKACTTPECRFGTKCLYAHARREMGIWGVLGSWPKGSTLFSKPSDIWTMAAGVGQSALELLDPSGANGGSPADNADSACTSAASAASSSSSSVDMDWLSARIHQLLKTTPCGVVELPSLAIELTSSADASRVLATLATKPKNVEDALRTHASALGILVEPQIGRPSLLAERGSMATRAGYMPASRVCSRRDVRNVACLGLHLATHGDMPVFPNWAASHIRRFACLTCYMLPDCAIVDYDKYGAGTTCCPSCGEPWTCLLLAGSSRDGPWIPIRPAPVRDCLPPKRFAMCLSFQPGGPGRCSHSAKCAFSHSKEERNEWNYNRPELDTLIAEVAARCEPPLSDVEIADLICEVCFTLRGVCTSRPPVTDTEKNPYHIAYHRTIMCKQHRVEPHVWQPMLPPSLAHRDTKTILRYPPAHARNEAARASLPYSQAREAARGSTSGSQDSSALARSSTAGAARTTAGTTAPVLTAVAAAAAAPSTLSGSALVATPARYVLPEAALPDLHALAKAALEAEPHSALQTSVHDKLRAALPAALGDAASLEANLPVHTLDTVPLEAIDTFATWLAALFEVNKELVKAPAQLFDLDNYVVLRHNLLLVDEFAARNRAPLPALLSVREVDGRTAYVLKDLAPVDMARAASLTVSGGEVELYMGGQTSPALVSLELGLPALMRAQLSSNEANRTQTRVVVQYRIPFGFLDVAAYAAAHAAIDRLDPRMVFPAPLASGTKSPAGELPAVLTTGLVREQEAVVRGMWQGDNVASSGLPGTGKTRGLVSGSLAMASALRVGVGGGRVVIVARSDEAAEQIVKMLHDHEVPDESLYWIRPPYASRAPRWAAPYTSPLPDDQAGGPTHCMRAIHQLAYMELVVVSPEAGALVEAAKLPNGFASTLVVDDAHSVPEVWILPFLALGDGETRVAMGGTMALQAMLTPIDTSAVLLQAWPKTTVMHLSCLSGMSLLQRVLGGHAARGYGVVATRTGFVAAPPLAAVAELAPWSRRTADELVPDLPRPAIVVHPAEIVPGMQPADLFGPLVQVLEKVAAKVPGLGAKVDINLVVPDVSLGLFLGSALDSSESDEVKQLRKNIQLVGQWLAAPQTACVTVAVISGAAAQVAMLPALLAATTRSLLVLFGESGELGAAHFARIVGSAVGPGKCARRAAVY
ncbi:uncharacterized protein AMSG_10837 [Thecamonas trahens ATCC 50062]|uniref:C3H1-type domain-containing protein n=1 Tax=Thecamonas trahens ATCC 50062 TaxID=461836 RepID=A0A0L0DUP7_THETB|nr:hypothetical protein AMSG_10837 [Thecamonas trahens ATCC 50062]KNC55213.1 hypothetical protein AMSG_10837 [Thecamonas trahens ATCC 50062]|eukprot:XP_013753145.1 hypothetical protein AMSG_10837 [Thecamonas trahens ATCC 50062]